MKWYFLPVSGMRNTRLQSWTKIVKNFTFSLRHWMPILQIWLCWGPTPHPRVVNVVQLRSEMIKQDLNIVFYFWGEGGGGGGGGVFVTVYAFKSFILIRIRHGNFCSKLWLFNPLFLHVVNKGQHRKKFIAFFKFQIIVSCFCSVLLLIIRVWGSCCYCG